MLAVALCLALFGFWMLLGLALVRPLETRMTDVRKLLLAPAVGLAANGLPLFVLNIFGVPVSKSAIPVGLVLFLGAAFSLWKRWMSATASCVARSAARRASVIVALCPARHPLNTARTCP